MTAVSITCRHVLLCFCSVLLCFALLIYIYTSCFAPWQTSSNCFAKTSQLSVTLFTFDQRHRELGLSLKYRAPQLATILEVDISLLPPPLYPILHHHHPTTTITINSSREVSDFLGRASGNIDGCLFTRPRHCHRLVWKKKKEKKREKAETTLGENTPSRPLDPFRPPFF